MSKITSNERALLGLALLDPATIDRVELELCGYQWLDRTASVLWPILCELRGKGVQIGHLPALVTELKVRGAIEQIGGIGELGKLTQQEAGSVGLEQFYVTELVRETARNKLSAILANAIDRASREDSDPLEIVEQLEATMANVVYSRSILGRTVGHYATQAYLETQKQKSRRGVMVGHRDVDAMIGGFYPGELVIVAARPSIGKSALGAQWCYYVGSKGIPSLFVSLEMNATECARRTIAFESGISFKKIRQADLSKSDRSMIESKLPIIDKSQMYLEDRRGSNIDKLLMLIRAYRQRYGIGFVVVDYLGLVRPSGRAFVKKFEYVSEHCKLIKELAASEQIPIVLLCQLNRDSEGSVPKLSNLRDSGAIEEDADVVFLLHRQDRDAVDTELHCEKSRNGETGVVKLRYQGQEYRFLDFGAVEPASVDGKRMGAGVFSGLGNYGTSDDY